jgi:DNA helicase-2/ATP-dependent DNA helicase PcrA
LEISTQVRDGVSIIKAHSGINLSTEQEQVVYRFNDSQAVFANPGTGKTTTATAGLIAAQTIHGIPGKKINAMSFTKLATAELASRYKAACKRCSIVANVNFNTFHSICFKIIKKAYPDFTIRKWTNIEAELKDFKDFLKSEGVERHDDMYFAKEVFKAINSLNNELLFSKSSVESSSKFINIQEGITLKQFQIVRSRWFKRNFITQSITQGDIPTMVLFILFINPRLIDELKKEYELMVVDEFQDMSVLYLEILSLISKKLIVIGDLKQQIYGFNGASLLILEAYKSMYPEAPTLELTQSFRCKDEIVQYANDVIAPNEIEGYLNFKGSGPGGKVSIVENSSDIFDDIVDRLKVQQDNKEFLDVMFLSRNNASVIPVIEKLFRKGVVFRTTKFAKVMNVPIFEDLCLMAEVALNPKDPEKVAKVNKFFPEFKWLSPSQNPLLEVMAKSPRDTDKSLLTMNYSFNMDSSYVIVNKLRRFVQLNTEQKQPFSVSCIPLLEIYEEFIIEGKWWKLDQPKEYYFNLVSSITIDKTYEDMEYDENEKFRLNEYYVSMNEGVRCYTEHTSKGLEAEEVYILDVDDQVVPKEKIIADLIEKGCALEAAKEIRNERNLLYVAITRTKRKLTLIHNGVLSKLISSPLSNGYTFLDTVWKEKAVLTDETKAFKALLGVKS